MLPTSNSLTCLTKHEELEVNIIYVLADILHMHGGKCQTTSHFGLPKVGDLKKSSRRRTIPRDCQDGTNLTWAAVCLMRDDAVSAPYRIERDT